MGHALVVNASMAFNEQLRCISNVIRAQESMLLARCKQEHCSITTWWMYGCHFDKSNNRHICATV